MDKETAAALRRHIKALRATEKGHTGPWSQGYRAALDDVLNVIRAAEDDPATLAVRNPVYD